MLDGRTLWRDNIWNETEIWAKPFVQKVRERSTCVAHQLSMTLDFGSGHHLKVVRLSSMLGFTLGIESAYDSLLLSLLLSLCQKKKKSRERTKQQEQVHRILLRYLVLLPAQWKITLEGFLHRNDSECCAENGFLGSTTGRREKSSKSDRSLREMYWYLGLEIDSGKKKK